MTTQNTDLVSFFIRHEKESKYINAFCRPETTCFILLNQEVEYCIDICTHIETSTNSFFVFSFFLVNIVINHIFCSYCEFDFLFYIWFSNFSLSASNLYPINLGSVFELYVSHLFLFKAILSVNLNPFNEFYFYKLQIQRMRDLQWVRVSTMPSINLIMFWTHPWDICDQIKTFL